MSSTVPTSPASTAIDLSRLPAPDVVEALDFETILTAWRGDFTARFPAFTAALESEPMVKLMEAGAYRELLLRQRINEAAKSLMIAHSRGADLEHLAAFFGVVRREITPANAQTGEPAVMESDTELRRRVLLAPDSYSVAGPTAAYVFHALAASGDVADVTATSPAPGEVMVSVLSVEGNGAAPQALLDQVEASVAADDVRPLTDLVTVASAVIVPFAIDARLTLYAGPDAALIEAEARKGLDLHLSAQRRIGRDITRSGLMAAMHVAGVQNIDLVAPAADLVIDDTQAAFAQTITLTIAGTGE